MLAGVVLGGLQGAATTRDTLSEETAQTHRQAWGRASGRNQAGKGGGPGTPTSRHQPQHLEPVTFPASVSPSVKQEQ